MMAKIHAPKDWNHGAPMEVIGEIDPAGVDYRNGQGTMSGDSYRKMMTLLPTNGFGVVTFEIHMDSVVLTGCRILAMASGGKLSFVYTDSKPVR